MIDGKKSRLRLFLRLLLALTLCFIWGNSLLSREDSAQLSGSLTEWLRSIGIPVSEHFLRKLAHFSEFGLLGCELTLLLWLRGVRRPRGMGFSALAALLAASADETIQIFTGRGSQVSDVLLDFSGALTGILLCTLIIVLVTKKRK